MMMDLMINGGNENSQSAFRYLLLVVYGRLICKLSFQKEKPFA